MTVIGVRDARATATAVLPTPVGPTMTGVMGRSLISHAKACPSGWGPSEPTLQFLFGKLDHGWPSVHIGGGKCGGEQADDELAHLVGVERLAGLDGGAARVRRRKSLQPILPTAKSAAGKIGDELLQAAGRFEARVRIRRRVDDDAAARERLDFVADAR